MEWCLHFSGKIMFYTHPPEQHNLPAHISAEIVHRWGSEFDVVSFFCVYLAHVLFITAKEESTMYNRAHMDKIF